MSALTYIASDAYLPERPNPHERHYSVNEALALGLDVPAHLLAPGIDREWKGAVYWSDRDIHFDLDNGTVEDGGFDDDFSVLPLRPGADIYSRRTYRSAVECIWTLGRAEKLLDYLRQCLREADAVEFWKVWIGCDEKPQIRHYSAVIDQLTPEDLVEIAGFSVFENEPVHHCLTVTKN